MNIEDKLTSALSGIVGIQQFLVGLPERKTAAEQILESKQYQQFAESKADTVKIEIKTAITSTGCVRLPSILSPEKG